MTDLFANTDNAMRPFLTDAVVVVRTRPGGVEKRTTVNACVFPMTDADVVSDAAYDTLGKRFSVILPRGQINDWNNLEDTPRIGDIVYHGGRRFTVKRFEERMDVFEMEVASC